MSSQVLILETNGWASQEIKIALKLSGISITIIEKHEKLFSKKNLPVGLYMDYHKEKALYYYRGSGFHQRILEKNIQPYTKLCDFI